MSLPNPETVVTEERLNEFYTELLPYLGRTADAGFTPVGTIIAVMGNSAPTNYLACNGQTVNIADYPELAAYFKAQFGSANYFGGDGTTTFKICDLRGEFLRGTGTNGHSGEGSGAAVGTHQAASQIIRLGCTSGTSAGDSSIRVYGSSVNTWGSNFDATVAGTHFKTVKQDSVITPSSGEDKNALIKLRPTNTSVLYCIATKNIYLNPSNDYSTSEKVVGKWIDGKTLYQKTFDVPAPQVVTDKTVVTSFAEIGATIDKAFIINATMITASGAILSLPTGTASVIKGTSPTQYVDAQVFVHVFTNKASDANLRNKVRVSNQATSYNTASFYVTIQYTKTTS